MKPKARWAFLVYLAGDNSLSDAGEADMAEMRKVGSNADVHIAAQFDRAGTQGTRRYYIRRGGKAEETADLGETDSGSAIELLKFVDWALAEFPAERCALVLWSHGSGWAPLDLEKIATQAKARDATREEAVERSGAAGGRIFFRETLEQIYELPTRPERAICIDDGSGHALDTLQLGKLLAHAQSVLGRKIDLLGMDACLMCTMEVAYQLRSACHYCVASEMPIPIQGWPYDAILKRLADNPGISAGDLAEAIVGDYTASYEQAFNQRSVSLTALDLTQAEGTARALDRLAGTLSGCLPARAADIWNSHSGALNFAGGLTDLASLCGRLEADANLAAAAEAARALRTLLRPGPGAFLRALGSFGAKAKGCGGVTAYLPALLPPSRFYPDLDFAKETAWPGMLQAYYEATRPPKG